MGVLPQIQAMTTQTAIYNTAITQVQQKTFPKQRGTNYQKKKAGINPIPSPAKLVKLTLTKQV